MLEHRHVIIRAKVDHPPQHFESPFLTNWFYQLVEDLGMKVLLGPYVTYCRMKGNRGWTGIAAIETSHIALHIWDEDKPSLLQLDVYTCSSLDLDVVMEALHGFGPSDIEYLLLDRKDELKLEGILKT